MLGLVLSGGGARGAYQSGVLNAVAEISAPLGLRQPFQIFTGASAGAINASFIASYGNDFINGSEKLSELWQEIRSEKVFHTDPISLSKIGLKWMKDLPLGGLTGTSAGPSLLNTDPLRKLILEQIDFAKIQKHLDSNIIRALTVTAVDYHSSMAATFVQSSQNESMWVRSRRFSEQSSLHCEHIMASSAIPLLFPPIRIGDHYYGDGCVRNLTPMSPAIHIGANRILVVGVRRETRMVQPKFIKTVSPEPTIARVMNMLLNAVLLDGVELDVERLRRINQFLEQLPADLQKGQVNFRKMDYVWVHPSIDIGQLAFEHANKLPRLIRYLLRGLGPNEDAKEIISYLLFEPEFTQKLLEIGYEDAMKQKESIQKLLLPV